MSKQAPKAICLKNYKPSDYLIERIDLRVELGEEATLVRSKLRVVRNPVMDHSMDHNAPCPLVLDGQELELLELCIDGRTLPESDYRVDSDHLILDALPACCELEILTRIRPQCNTSLEGLYKSNGNFCTQCEAEGFRKITYCLDRPDVMSVYTTTIVADKGLYPVLLSNGNQVDSGELNGGRHWVTWSDPHRKPTYLFALVAGRLDCVEDTFITRSGRRVVLRLYVEPGHTDQCEHAMRSLKKAMVWDEQVFGLEYDLDVYMIVAVGDFNAGAMENKGLNIFNTKYVLAKPETATDADYQGIEGVIAHEYFHNWTGNRVTCRDWFQLSLKEGLTVFRDQEFSADMGSRGVKRIDDVRLLRATQFPQDAGPMAHPVRPDSYIEINNFYTATVYNKGAEVVRMIHNLVGTEGFRKGMDLYFERHDGQAVTCDDFVGAMEDANSVDLGQFRLWYSQAGTPELTAKGSYDANSRSYTLGVSQVTLPTPEQPLKKPMHIPLAIGLLDSAGRELPLQLEGENAAIAGTRVLELSESEHHFRFVNITEPPTPSLLRGFSAPVKLAMDYSDEDLMFLLAHDSDDFNRWEAGQQLAVRTLLRLLEARKQGQAWSLPAAIIDAFAKVLGDVDTDPALLSQVLNLPSEAYLAEQMAVADVDGIHEARDFMRHALAEALRERWLALYEAYSDSGCYSNDAAAMGRRSLKNRCLDYLMQLDDPTTLELCLHQFRTADNMTDEIGALGLLANRECKERQPALETFFQRWQHEPLVVDKWLALQATSQLPGALGEVKSLMKHPAFNLKNPNKVRSLIGSFCQANPVRFHAVDGAGYAFLADQVLALNAMNPQVAARLLGALTRWHKYDTARQRLMRRHLERILAASDLSPDVYEITAKSLSGLER